MNKIKANRIDLTRVEGRNDQDYSTHTFTTTLTTTCWDLANEWLRKEAQEAPKNGTYDKFDFTIYYIDSYYYQGTYYLKHSDIIYADIARHIKKFLEYISTLPAYADNKAEYLEFIDTYELPVLHMTGTEYFLLLNREDLQAYLKYLFRSYVPYQSGLIGTYYKDGQFMGEVPMRYNSIITQEFIDGSVLTKKNSSITGNTGMAAIIKDGIEILQNFS